MTSVARSLAGIAAALDERGRRWALVGGLAVSCHVDPRFTRDIDIAVVVADDADAESLVHALVSAGYTVMAALEQDVTARLATVRLRGPGTSDVIIDLLFASSGIEAETCDRAANFAAFPTIVVSVATRAHLIAMKLLRQWRHGPAHRHLWQPATRLVQPEAVARGRGAGAGGHDNRHRAAS